MTYSPLLYGKLPNDRLTWPSNRLDGRPEATVIQVWIKEDEKKTFLEIIEQLATIASAELVDMVPGHYSFELVATAPGAPQPPPTEEQLLRGVNNALATVGVDYCRPQSSPQERAT